MSPSLAALSDAALWAGSVRSQVAQALRSVRLGDPRPVALTVGEAEAVRLLLEVFAGAVQDALQPSEDDTRSGNGAERPYDPAGVLPLLYAVGQELRERIETSGGAG